jgi:hypothetical protein
MPWSGIRMSAQNVYMMPEYVNAEVRGRTLQGLCYKYVVDMERMGVCSPQPMSMAWMFFTFSANNTDQ